MIRGVGAGYHARMTLHAAWSRTVGRPAGAPLRWLAGWGRILFFGACVLVLALSPSTYTPQVRRTMARHIWLDTAPVLRWFSVLCALLTVVITHIVVVTALSYGLSRYALEMVVRVLVLELIPLVAALFVALRCTIPNGAALAEMRRSGVFDDLHRRGVDPVVTEVVPRAVAGLCSTLVLAAISCTLALALAYLTVYGFTLAGLPGYTHMFGHVFAPTVAVVFLLKTLFFSLAVAIIPMASGLYDIDAGSSRESVALQGLVRMFGVLLVLEALSLVGNYY